MVKKMALGFCILVVSGIVIVLLLHQPLIRPWYMRWGATDVETKSALVGDGIVTGEGISQSTRAIDVHAPASNVWPWILQVGQGRGGFYSYDWLENLAGCDIHTLDQIEPDLQDLKVGDTIRLGVQDGLPPYRVMLIEPGQAMVMQSVNPKTGEMGETWGFYLLEQQPGLTRLVIRHRSLESADATERAVNAIFEPLSFVMEQRMLHGIRERAETLKPVLETAK